MLITRAPLRISFFGGGTDFPEFFRKDSGAVLASAIDKYSYITASRFYSSLFKYNIRVSYSKGELTNSVSELKHVVFRACLKHCRIHSDIELHTVADLPSFAGLGSSSSFTVALLTALYAYKGLVIPTLRVAHEAIYIERDILKECVGIQDQTIAAVGGFNVFEFRSADEIKVVPVNLSGGRLLELERHLVLVFTGITRRASDIETEKIKFLESNRAVLRNMRRMVDKGLTYLQGNGSLEKFGALLGAAWTAKRSLSRSVTNARIELLHQEALRAGAWGGKLLGAGGGGFFLFCAPPETHSKIASVFRQDSIIPVRLNAEGVSLIYDERKDEPKHG